MNNNIMKTFIIITVITCISVIACVAIIMGVVSKNCNASERVQFYNTSEGWPKPTGNYADKQYDGSWRVYDSKGRLQSIIKDKRLYNRNGRVKEKYYLFTK